MNILNNTPNLQPPDFIAVEKTTEEKIKEINAKWIIDMMQDFKIKNARQLSILSGVRYESLTMWLSEKRPNVSSEGQKTLYWYFRFLDAERQIQEFNR